MTKMKSGQKKKSKKNPKSAKSKNPPSGDTTQDLQGEFDIYFRRGTELLHKGRAEEAIPYLEKANELVPDNLDCVINLGGANILSKKFVTAVEILEPFSKQHPDNSMIWINLGAAYLGNPVLAGDKKQEKAIQAFERALQINPIAPSVAYNIGLIYRDQQNNEKARYWFEQAVKHNPQDWDARRLLEKLS